jgi:hypothetical protein
MEDAPGPDPAAETGRLAGRAVNALGMRLLRTRSVRQAIRRAAQEAQEVTEHQSPRPDPPPAAGRETPS